MLTSDVIEYFRDKNVGLRGAKTRVARFLGIGKAAVSRWGSIVPPLRAMQLHEKTRGKLRFDSKDYEDWNRPERAA